MSEVHPLVQRLKATVRPSGEKAGEESGSDFVGGEVKLLVSPLSIDINIKLAATNHLPSGDQEGGPGELSDWKNNSVKTVSGPPNGEIKTTANLLPGNVRKKAMRRPSGDHAGHPSGAGLVVKRKGGSEPISLM